MTRSERDGGHESLHMRDLRLCRLPRRESLQTVAGLSNVIPTDTIRDRDFSRRALTIPAETAREALRAW